MVLDGNVEKEPKFRTTIYPILYRFSKDIGCKLRKQQRLETRYYIHSGTKTKPFSTFVAIMQKFYEFLDHKLKSLSPGTVYTFTATFNSALLWKIYYTTLLKKLLWINKTFMQDRNSKAGFFNMVYYGVTPHNISSLPAH